MDVLVLIDKLDEIVNNARPMPMTDKVMIDREEIYDILDQMRTTIPEEIKQARWIVKERQEMLAEAKTESDRIVKEANEQAERLVSEEEVVKMAERNAAQIMEDARAREREIRLGAEDYADEVLETLETNLGKFLAAVQRGRERLQGKSELEERAGRGPHRGLDRRSRPDNGPGSRNHDPRNFSRPDRRYSLELPMPDFSPTMLDLTELPLEPGNPLFFEKEVRLPPLRLAGQDYVFVPDVVAAMLKVIVCGAWLCREDGLLLPPGGRLLAVSGACRPRP